MGRDEFRFFDSLFVDNHATSRANANNKLKFSLWLLPPLRALNLPLLLASICDRGRRSRARRRPEEAWTRTNRERERERERERSGFTRALLNARGGESESEEEEKKSGNDASLV